MNSVALIGRLTAEPQSHAGDKHESATFRPAVPRNGSDGADFIHVVTFDKLAATCAQWLTKGREVAVVGKLRLNEWTSREGERRSEIQVVADSVQFLGGPSKASKPTGRPTTNPLIRRPWVLTGARPVSSLRRCGHHPAAAPPPLRRLAVKKPGRVS